MSDAAVKFDDPARWNGHLMPLGIFAIYECAACGHVVSPYGERDESVSRLGVCPKADIAARRAAFGDWLTSDEGIGPKPKRGGFWETDPQTEWEVRKDTAESAWNAGVEWAIRHTTLFGNPQVELDDAFVPYITDLNSLSDAEMHSGVKARLKQLFDEEVCWLWGEE